MKKLKPAHHRPRDFIKNMHVNPFDAVRLLRHGEARAILADDAP